ITVVLYGMIGLLGAKIWKENGVDFANPINLVPLAAGIVIGIGDVKMKVSDDFTLSGIALGTIVAIAGYHLARVIAPSELREHADGTALAVGDYVYGDADQIDDLYQDGYPGSTDRK
ncbi:MAG TPA: nitrate reductase, partial [Ornithinibacter sp.]|nr:nitrate reductase [Ornithinibacter sp.]